MKTKKQKQNPRKPCEVQVIKGCKLYSLKKDLQPFITRSLDGLFRIYTSLLIHVYCFLLFETLSH